MRSKIFKVLWILAAVSGTLMMSSFLTQAVTAVGPKTAAGSGVVLPADIAGGRYAEAYKKLELIRFHVIANSDNELDQAMKLRVRDLIVQKMTPEFAKADNLTEARAIAKAHLAEIEAITAQEIKAWGKNYSVSVQLGRYDFPAKTYGELTLPASNYEAVRIVIGQGRGANWWCVLFPPLCFVDVSKSYLPQETAAANPKQFTDSDKPVYEVKFKILELLGKK